MSLLTIIQRVTALLSLPVPTTVVGSSDRQVMQLLALANEQGDDLASGYDWQSMTSEFTFVTTATEAQATAIPADWGHWIPNTFFNRSTRRPILGPLTPRDWQLLKALPVYGTAYLSFRERLGILLMIPTPPAGQNIYGEYVSINWAKSAALVPQPAYVADTDLTFLDEGLMALGIRWRFLKSKGLEYGEDLDTYERNLEQNQGRDGGSTALNMGPRQIDLSRVNLPDGNFGR